MNSPFPHLLTALFIALCGSGFISAQQATRSSAVEVCESAVGAHQRGALSEAAELYAKCLREQPSSVELRSNFGAVLASLGRYQEAVAEYEIALTTATPQTAVRLHQNLALACYKSGDLIRAAAEFKLAHEALPDDSRISLILADTLLRLGDSKGAVMILTPLQSALSSNNTFTYLYGMALLRERKVAEAQVQIDRILSQGDTAEAHLLLGFGMLTARDYPGAGHEFRRASELNPDLPGLHSLYGQALLYLGDATLASEQFRLELGANPNDFEANLRLAQVLKQRQHPSEAAPFAEKATQLQPQSIEAGLTLAEVRISNGQTESARVLLQRLTLDHPESPLPYQQMAVLLMKEGRKREAEAQLEDAKRLAGVAENGELAADQPDEKGPKPGDVAPDFELQAVGRSDTASRIRLSQFRQNRPIVLIFASYSCPQFRMQVPTIQRVFKDFGDNLPFLMVYIREAHSAQNWESTMNERDGIQVQPDTTAAVRESNASICVNRLSIRFPTALDSMDNYTDKRYAAWPSRLFVLDRAGRVAFSTRFGELDFDSVALTRAIQRVIETAK